MGMRHCKNKNIKLVCAVNNTERELVKDVSAAA